MGTRRRGEREKEGRTGGESEEKGGGEGEREGKGKGEGKEKGKDTLVTVWYFKSPNPHSNAWASLTLAFTLGPSIVMQIFSASWYVADEDMTKWRWIMHLLQLAPLQRYIRVFRTGLIARKSDDPLDFQRLHHQQSDVSMLRLFEAFLESAPQVVLQLYIMMATEDENTFTGISASVSLFSLCWAMVAYSKNHRKVRNDKNAMSIPGLLLQTIWRIGMISSRVMALVLFASFTQVYIFVFAAIHWFCMTIWVYIQNTDFCDSWVEERIFNGVIGVIYIFCFFNLKEGNSRFRVTLFYAIMFGENVILITVWYKYRDTEMIESWYDPVGFGIVFGGFAIGKHTFL
ncbi:XK-related protein 6-like [Amphiura filiformis]|uniref:XK-related protein 6-like n=1 Tax=Amphiura filiformis TaxID=82378 RepID=UPI003B21CCBC